MKTNLWFDFCLLALATSISYCKLRHCDTQQVDMIGNVSASEVACVTHCKRKQNQENIYIIAQHEVCVQVQVTSSIA